MYVPFAKNIQKKIEHLFWNRKVWFKIEHFILTSIHYVIDINRESAIFLNGNLKKLNLENYILLPTRYSIYNCRIQNKMPLLSTWKILIR